MNLARATVVLALTALVGSAQLVNSLAAELAESRDLSFVRRIEILSLNSVSVSGKTVLLRGLFQLGHEEEILLDPARGVMVDEGGEPWGRFLL